MEKSIDIWLPEEVAIKLYEDLGSFKLLTRMARMVAIRGSASVGPYRKNGPITREEISHAVKAASEENEFFTMLEVADELCLVRTSLFMEGFREYLPWIREEASKYPNCRMRKLGPYRRKNALDDEDASTVEASTAPDGVCP